jgi:ribosome-binding protein aMBF1 (putative translation factor)
VLRSEGRPTHAVIPWAEWQRIRELAHDAEDAADAARALATPPEDLTPLAVVEAIVGGANAIRAWREHRGMTLTGLARRIDVGQPVMARLEAGQMPSVPQLRRLAEAFGIGVNALVAGLDP